MKKLANSLVSVLSALVIVFAAACAYSFADIDVTDKHTSAESSERVSESSEAEDTSQDNSLSTQTTKTHGTADVNVSAAATESSAGKTENINKPTDTKTEKTSSDSEIGTITLEINEVGDGWFTACHPWPSPNQYEVIYTLDKRYKSGDIVEVPKEIAECSGIIINGKRIKSLIFTTDIAIVMNNNADAIFAVYPFTPHPSIFSAITSVAQTPTFTAV